MYILTDISGHLIDSRDTPWATMGEYRDACFRIVIAAVPDGYRPVSVESWGDPVAQEFTTRTGPVTCPHVYPDAVVLCEEIGEGDA